MSQELDDAHSLALAANTDTAALMADARVLRDEGFGHLITYSRKVFIPLTQLCRDVCHYCTFAQAPKKIAAPYLPVDQVLATVKQGAALGCKEALFTLGERPELRYAVARDALAALGHDSTLGYLAEVARAVLDQTGVLPHINAGCMSADEIALLRPVSASMGIMLESSTQRLCEKGMPHHGSPDKAPQRRLETIRLAGEMAVPFTSGILIGIGETRRERIESLLALRELHRRYGHIQEIILQNFRAKPGTKMADAPEPELDELLWTIAVARLIFGPTMSLQAPPNLNPGVLAELIDAGLNDWGGVSPLTPDYVNPEAPWPHLDQLTQLTAQAGKLLQERLTIYPAYAAHGETWLDKNLRRVVLRKVDAEGYPRIDSWLAGQSAPPPGDDIARLAVPAHHAAVAPRVRAIIARAAAGEAIAEDDIVRLFAARGDEFTDVCRAADDLRRAVNGDMVSYVVNRNINYTNVCTFKCGFCAFSKGSTRADLRGTPYDLDHAEIARRCAEAWARGATEVCLQGGIHPDYTGHTYLKILETVRTATSEMHIHAFSPLEVWQGAKTLGLPLRSFLHELKSAGLHTLPGTAAEILDDEVRAVICPDKINTAQWLEVIETAHAVGLKTTATIMFGHVEKPVHWARHLLRVRALQARSGGISEFVPLPFVAAEAPHYRKGGARQGPTFREAVLMHAVARLVFHGLIDNIQASWVKMGHAGAVACLNAGCNDLGGTLMNESITRAAGAQHGQETPPAQMRALIAQTGRVARQRTTRYGDTCAERRHAAESAAPLRELIATPLRARRGRVLHIHAASATTADLG
jgi:FO synthase